MSAPPPTEKHRKGLSPYRMVLLALCAVLLVGLCVLILGLLYGSRPAPPFASPFAAEWRL